VKPACTIAPPACTIAPSLESIDIIYNSTQ
jgi:hypothetical protein